MESQDPQELEAQTSASTYTVIKYHGASLPQQYHNVILARWLRTYRFGNEYFKLIDQAAYYATYDLYIKQILTRPNTEVRLAVLTVDNDVVLGWSVVENDTLHYVHVEKDVRKIGIGTSLVPTNINTITHITNTGASIWASKCITKPDVNSTKPLVVFNPFK